ncbi:glycosyltransferase family 4 protein, partial [Cetobacterium sp.]|uniref:glycosyltransferase family 4 protein n=1 Tax=Cetobacterium sp. TaxID=2071632 RepID=UPI003EE67484
MKKILLLLDNFTPDLGASSFRFESIVRKLLKNGYAVDVLCSYPNRINMEYIEELNLENLNVFRINKTILKGSVFSRGISYFKFLINSLKIGLNLGKNSDLIIASSPQLLVGVSGSIIALLNRKKMILDIRDLWPDIVLDMNIMKKYNPIYFGLKVLEKIMYLGADTIVYNSPGFRSYLEKQNKEMSLITNGLDDYILDFFKLKNSEKKLNSNKYKIMYAGNLGIAQDLVLLTEFVEKYANEVEVILIGQGSQEKEIISRIEEKKINNIKVLNSLPREELLYKYLEADILFLQLKNIKMFQKTIPSKIFEYMATGKPIIYGLEGIGKQILENFNQKYYFK